MQRGTVLASVLAVLVPSSLAAQSVRDICQSVMRPLKVGQWAQYEIRSPQIAEAMNARMAVVGSEEVTGKPHFWYEMKMASPQGEMVMQALVPQFPYDPSAVQRIVMKAPGQPAMEMPTSMMGMMQRNADPGAFASRALADCQNATIVGTESITVPAGQFQTTHIRSSGSFNGDAWISMDVPFGLVKLTSDRQDQMTLLGHGRDAKSSITETPTKMPGKL